MSQDAAGRAAIDSPLDDVRGVFGPRLKSFVAIGRRGAGGHGSAESLASSGSPVRAHELHTLALVDSIDAQDLRACASFRSAWAKRGLAVPLLLTAEELIHSLDAFPLELNEIVTHHQVLFGRSPFDGLSVPAGDLRRACEVQARSHLLHLREGYLETGGHPKAVAELFVASIGALRVLLSNVAQLQGAEAGSIEDLARHLESTAALSAGVVRQVLAIEASGSIGAADAEALFPAYLNLVEQLVRYIDAWRE